MGSFWLFPVLQDKPGLDGGPIHRPDDAFSAGGITAMWSVWLAA